MNGPHCAWWSKCNYHIALFVFLPFSLSALCSLFVISASLLSILGVHEHRQINGDFSGSGDAMQMCSRDRSPLLRQPRDSEHDSSLSDKCSLRAWNWIERLKSERGTSKPLCHFVESFQKWNFMNNFVRFCMAFDCVFYSCEANF